MHQNLFFFSRFGAETPVLELQFLASLHVVLICSNVFRNSVSADPIVMAASRFLAAAAECRILVSFTAESHKSHWRKVANGALAAVFFSILALMIFLLKFLLESASKSSFFLFGVEIQF